MPRNQLLRTFGEIAMSAQCYVARLELVWWTADSDFTELKEAHPAFRNARSGPALLYTPSEGRCGLSGITFEIRYVKRVAGPSNLRHRASAGGYAVVQVFM